MPSESEQHNGDRRPDGRLADPLIGHTFAGRYRVERRLGQGGMGVVYAARQLTMDRLVALKVLSSDLGASPSARARFVREMRATARIEHPNTVRVYDFGEDEDGHLFLTMELIDGRTLQDDLRRRGALELSRVLTIGEAIAKALAAAHSEGVVHRDLKPENVMIVDRYGETDEVRVLDFGIARLLDGDEDDAVTRTGSLIGTPLYMSPEAATGQKVDHRADLYALGLVLYQMVAGRVPFSDPMPVRVLMMHAHEVPPPLSVIAPGRGSAALEALISALLAKSPDDRPQQATEVGRALRAIAEAPTLHGADAGLISRLAGDSEAMAAGRARHADPELAVGTLRDATAALTPGSAHTTPPVTIDHGADVSAVTFIADGADRIAIDADVDVAAPTFFDENAPLATSAPIHAPAPTTVATTAPTPMPMPTSVPTSVPTVAPHSRRVPAMAAGLAGLAGLTVLGWWLFRPSAPQSTANAASPSAVVAGAGEHVGAVPSAAVAQGGEAATPDRPMLNARYAAAGMPQPSENCATRDHAAMAAIYAALGDLNGTKAQRRGAGDAGAVAALEGHKDAEALVLLSVALLGAGRDHVAVADAANRGLAACPQQALAHRVLGMVHLQGARWQVAADVFARAIALAPADAECHHRLGVAQLGLHAAADAATAFAAALALDPTLDDAAVGLGRARLAQRDHMGAMAALVTLARRTPPRADALFFLAAAEEANGDTEAARRDFCASAAAGYSHAELKCPSHKR